MYTKYSIVIQTGCDTEIIVWAASKMSYTKIFQSLAVFWKNFPRKFGAIHFVRTQHILYTTPFHKQIAAPRHCWLGDKLTRHLVSHITGSSIRNTWREEDRGRTGWATFTWKTTNKKDEIIIHHLIVYHRMPSVLWHCWLGGRKGIRPIKNWVMRYWSGYLFAARCKWFAYGPADATAISSSLASVKSRMVYLSGAGLPRLSWKKGR